MAASFRPVVICGLGNMGFRLAELLLSLGETVTVVAANLRPHWRRTLEVAGATVVEGDARLIQNLSAAGVRAAKSVVVAVDKDTVATEIAAVVRDLNPTVPLVVRASDEMWADFFRRGFDYCKALCVANLSAVSFAAAAVHEDLLFSEKFHGHVFMLSHAHGDQYAGLTVDEANDRHHLSIYTVNGEPPDPGHVIQPDDVIVYGFALREAEVARRHAGSIFMRIAEALRVVSIVEVGQLIVDVWRNASRAMRGLFILLNILVLVTAYVYFLRSPTETITDSLLYAVSTAAGVSLDPATQNGGAWDLFDILVIVCGAGLAAILFTMIAEYIISRRLLDLAGRMPTRLRNHVIIAGMGKVGHRVAELLLAQRQAVVGIDARPDPQQSSGLRGVVPLLTGDAGDPDVLHRANVKAARAIIAATDEDANNIRIALNAERLNPKIETVIRVYDLSLARTVDRTTSIHSAVSPADTAAPTFALAALCPEALFGFMVHDHLIGVYEHQVADGDGFCGKTPDELAEDAVFTGLVSRNGRDFAPWPAPEPLEAGHTVVFGGSWEAASCMYDVAPAPPLKRED